MSQWLFSLIPVPPEGNSSNLMMYLGKTYKQWTEKSTPVYLATVKDNSFNPRSAGNLSIEIGDETEYGNYSNGLLKATEKYQ